MSCVATIDHEVTATYPVAASDDGYGLSVIGTFVQTAGTTTIPLNETSGNVVRGYLGFTVHSDFDADGKPLDPPIFTDLTITLTLASNIGLGVSRTVKLYYCTDPTETNPFTPLAAGTNTLLTSGQFSSTAAGTELDLTITAGTINPYYLKSDWNGVLVFELRTDSATGPTIATAENATYDGAVLTAESVSFLTGISGPWRAQSRVDRCDKCGLIDVREKFVKDGFNPGLWVCKDCWDPEDLPYEPIPPDAPPIND